MQAGGQPPPVAHLLQMVQVAPGITNKPWHVQGCPATTMPCGEWKHFTTAACSFPLDPTSLFRGQALTLQGRSAQATAALAARRGRNSKQTRYYNYFRIVWHVFYRSKLPFWLCPYCCGPMAAGQQERWPGSHTPCHSMPTLPQQGSLLCWRTRATTAEGGQFS